MPHQVRVQDILRLVNAERVKPRLSPHANPNLKNTRWTHMLRDMILLKNAGVMLTRVLEMVRLKAGSGRIIKRNGLRKDNVAVAAQARQ